MAKNRKPKKLSFRKAVDATPEVSGAYLPGLRALASRDRSLLAQRHIATGSVALDGWLRKLPKYKNANRWDYGIGLPHSARSERVLWLEPHRSGSGEARAVVKKKDWLVSWLRNEASSLNQMNRVFVWLVTNRAHNPNDRARRMTLAERHGIRLAQGQLRLSEV